MDNLARLKFKLPEQPILHAQRIYELIEEAEGKQAAEKALLTFTRSVASAPSLYWTPNGPQERLINLFDQCINNPELNDSDVATIICTYANGVGKTEIIRELIVNLIYGSQNGWFNKQIFKNWTLPKRIWYCTTPNMLKNKVVPNLVKALDIASKHSKIQYIITEEEVEMTPQDGTDVKNTKGHTEWVQKMEFSNGWSIYFFSFNQSPKELEGDEVGLIINDEPAPESFNKAQKSRRRMGNITIHIMTPLYCDPYLVNDYKQAKEKNIQGTFTLEASVYEVLLDQPRGHLNRKTMERMLEEYDEDEKDARIYGRFMFFSTRIYPTFKRSIHMAEPLPNGFNYYGRIVEIPEGSILKMINDPKDGIMDAVIWAWKFPNGRMYVFAESPLDRSTFFWKNKKRADQRDKLLEWYKIEQTHPRYPDRRIIDKIFGIEQTRNDSTLADEYYKMGLKLKKEMSDPNLEFFFFASHAKKKDKGMVKYRHEMVRKALKVQPDGMPNLIISSELYHVPNGMENYVRKYNINALNNTMEVDADPVPKFSDFPDTIGFLACDEQDYIKNTDEKEEELPPAKNWAEEFM